MLHKDFLFTPRISKYHFTFYAMPPKELVPYQKAACNSYVNHSSEVPLWHVTEQILAGPTKSLRQIKKFVASTARHRESVSANSVS